MLHSTRTGAGTGARAGWRIGRRLVAGAAVAAALLTAGCAGPSEDTVTIGLITKQEENPYWVTMREVAERAASDAGATLLTATGESDVDVESQRAAIVEMVDQGADGILIAPTDSTALNDTIAEAREAGVIVIALDTPVDPLDAVDAYFATDNLKAGQLVGEYAAAKADELGLEPKVAMLDLSPGIASGEQRRDGFLEGFGLNPDSPELVASANTEGNRALGRTAMTAALEQTPDINVVYTVNEPAALGALEALETAGADLDEIVVVSIDGGCEAIKSEVRGGGIDATAQQFPENMAREGVRAIVEAVRSGEPPTGFLDTGVQLITDSPAPGVDSRDTAFGVRNCWG